jgi:hypothetical protein
MRKLTISDLETRSKPLYSRFVCTRDQVGSIQKSLRRQDILLGWIMSPLPASTLLFPWAIQNMNSRLQRIQSRGYSPTNILLSHDERDSELDSIQQQSRGTSTSEEDYAFKVRAPSYSEAAGRGRAVDEADHLPEQAIRHRRVKMAAKRARWGEVHSAFAASLQVIHACGYIGNP